MKKLRIDEMFAFVAIDEDGDEGIAGFQAPDGQWLPMVGADMARVASLRPIARDIARVSGKTLRLLRFTTREELEVLKP